MKNVKVFEIEAIKFEGKWAEFWFKGFGNGLNRYFDTCCKAYMLDQFDLTPKGYIDTMAMLDCILFGLRVKIDQGL